MGTIFALLHLLLVVLVVFATASEPSPVPEELRVGFTATPDSSFVSFQPLLKDSSGSYSLGFLKIQPGKLSLSIIHLPSEVTIWSGATARWDDETRFFFNGSLVLSDPHTGVLWSTRTSGDRVWISNTSNLIVHGGGDTVMWQSFDFPTDTLVESQNFTSTMELVSSNMLYSMRLGDNYIGFYANLGGVEQMYFKHGALQAKAEIVEGIPIYMTIKSDGYMGIFQSNNSIPADVEAFNTFQRNLTGPRRLRLEPDGNFKGYYWTGTNWVLDYELISDFCRLPNPCGSYGLCNPDKDCSCLNNQSRTCAPPRDPESGNFCGEKFNVLRRTGIEFPFKELMSYQIMASFEECEASCASNCSCHGVVYSNSSGFCYAVDFPVPTLVAIDDETRIGYFKVREGAGKSNVGMWLLIFLGVGLGVTFIILGIVGIVLYKSRRRGVKGYLEEECIGVGPYKDLGSSSGSASFRSIELCHK